ncbi:VanZ family protein, partial [Rhodoferax sp.]|uniref:VanZ family protein n=1 Tax=Rhodoferax sp. TaxID=50421 RepID=UPI0019F9B070
MTLPPPHSRTGYSAVAWLFVLYVLFVVYGSLVPLEYVDRSLADAVQAFRNIPFLTLGVASRADWVANGVLYVPVGFLTAAVLLQSYSRLPRVLLFMVAAAFSMALAVAVEFTQLFFPPRTVSLNDLIAEGIGSLIGVALAARFTGWLRSLFASFFGDTERLKKLALEGYAVAYIAFALFPYDLLLSGIEVQAKFDSDSWGWWLAGNSPRPMLLGLQMLAEAALTLPFGFLLARLSAHRVPGYAKAVLLGAALGILIETAQFFIASGISQGMSVLTRALGLGAGLALARYSARWTADNISTGLRRYTLPLVAAYVLAMLEINGWLTTHWQGLRVAQGQLEQLSVIPFYYHYYTTEAKALFSLAAVSLSYVPIGVLAWAHRRTPGFALVVSLALATCIELGKLFLPPSHPDLTNLLLASAASWFTVTLLRRVTMPRVMDCRASLAMTGSTASLRGAPAPWQSMPPDSLHPIPIWLFLCLLATAIWVFNFPAFPWLVGLVLAASAVAVWYRPIWAFVIIPAALPVFDLAPWSGRFFLDEFDALLLICLAVAYNRAPAPSLKLLKPDLALALVGGLVALSFVISAILGLQAAGLPDTNSFNSYFSPYNALRIVKGAVWAALFIGLFRRFGAAGIDARRPFAWGMVAGLGLTVAVIVWERLAFSELWNFADGYRVTGPFSAGHTGGAYVDGYLAAAMPFLMVLTFAARRWQSRVAGVLLMLAASYALLVTFS